MKKVFSFIALFILIAISASAKGPKTLYRNALIFAYSQANSIYEDDNIKLEIYDEKLWATNKTSKTIFIDLAQCFLIHNESSYPMFSKQQNERHASKKGKATSIAEFITVAPATGNKQNETLICNMATCIYGKYTTTESPSGDFSVYDKRFLNLIASMVKESQNADPKGKLYIGSVSRHLTEDESVNNIGASIAYAFNKNSEKWESVSISTWVSDVVFAPCYVVRPVDLNRKDKRGFGIKETAPAKIHVKAKTPFVFDEEKSPLVVADWSGNFKAGTFVLSTTYITKKIKKGFILVNPEYYKRAIIFDGSDANWGKLKYVRKGINFTSQK